MTNAKKVKRLHVRKECLKVLAPAQLARAVGGTSAGTVESYCRLTDGEDSAGKKG